MRNIIKYIVLFFLFCACEKEKTTILDLGATKDEISRIELRADHKTLIPDGISKMEFYTFVYGKKKVQSYYKDDEGEYVSEEVEKEYLIPNDILPKDYVKVLDMAGNEIDNGLYSTTTDAPGTVLDFYAKAGSIESNKISVTIRSLSEDSYEEIVIPVIFHLLLPPASSGPTYDVSKEYLEQVLQEMNDVFNKRMTTDPNGGNAKVTFKLAAYDQAGVRLQEPGKHVVELSTSNMSLIKEYADDDDMDIAYNKFIVRYKSAFVWDPNKYLNVWIAKYTDEGYYDPLPYQYKFPTVMHSDYALESIPGLGNITTKDDFNYVDVKDCLEVGIMINYTSFLTPSDNFSFAGIVGGYYGLYFTDQDESNDWVDGDNDYCPDTYYYYSGYSSSIFKNTRLYREDVDAEYEWFTSFNVMDAYSRNNSISVDQASRLRKVMKQCPSRWAYKSDWAFTGK
ncbi:hypothetical protein [Butyricimonas paravirosa]|uniref:hypothetical protein n=1 Tax=Butyricimonas paravirosa TaxID=1472417 RepID=UPI00210D5614|nr:hypothetical protein [Butyricimonas paravirosa]MCQ4872036.1 hypothetical protein [Butyricimonas paravirosa]